MKKNYLILALLLAASCSNQEKTSNTNLESTDEKASTDEVQTEFIVDAEGDELSINNTEAPAAEQKTEEAAPAEPMASTTDEAPVLAENELTPAASQEAAMEATMAADESTKQRRL